MRPSARPLYKLLLILTVVVLIPACTFYSQVDDDDSWTRFGSNLAVETVTWPDGTDSTFVIAGLWQHPNPGDADYQPATVFPVEDAELRWDDRPLVPTGPDYHPATEPNLESVPGEFSCRSAGTPSRTEEHTYHGTIQGWGEFDFTMNLLEPYAVEGLPAPGTVWSGGDTIHFSHESLPEDDRLSIQWRLNTASQWYHADDNGDDTYRYLVPSVNDTLHLRVLQRRKIPGLQLRFHGAEGLACTRECAFLQMFEVPIIP